MLRFYHSNQKSKWTKRVSLHVLRTCTKYWYPRGNNKNVKNFLYLKKHNEYHYHRCFYHWNTKKDMNKMCNFPTFTHVPGDKQR